MQKTSWQEYQEYVVAFLALFWFAASIMALIEVSAWLVSAGMSVKTLWWTPVQAQVSQAHIVIAPLPCGARNAPKPSLHYTYQIGDKTFSGNQFGGGQNYVFYANCGLDILTGVSPLKTHQNTRTATIWVNPERPGQSVLVRGLPPAWIPLKHLAVALGLWLLTTTLGKQWKTGPGH